MALPFADICFTPSVKAAQTRYGSREANRRFEMAQMPDPGLTAAEINFISERDSFYLATVSETGWPYVQHRGGPPGFLKVLDTQTLGFADYRGNRQYLSVGNLQANERVAMILMDYANRRRLKLWGRARVVEAQDDAALMARLDSAAYKARAERGMLIQLAAWEWNCPQHITPRYAEAEVQAVIKPLLEEIQSLKTQLARLENKS